MIFCNINYHLVVRIDEVPTSMVKSFCNKVRQLHYPSSMGIHVNFVEMKILCDRSSYNHLVL